jgi:hypothetical protein
MTNSSVRGLLYLGVLGLALATPTSAKAEPTGTSCADCPNYSGAFSITNQTGQTIKYQYRWGSEHAWKRMVLQTGHIETHSYPLGENPQAKAPSPYVRFDNRGGDGQTTFKDYHVRFTAVGYAGYGPKVNRTTPKPYYFRYAPNGKDLDLFSE